MGMFSGWLDGIAQRQFGKDEAGRVAFFPYGWRRSGYFVEAPDESKITALVKMYAVASALINLLGSMTAYALTQSLIFDQHSIPLRRKLELALSVYSISALILFILPALLLWKVYRGLVAGLCSPLPAVGPESVRQIKPPTAVRAQLVLVGFGTAILVLGILLALTARHPH